MNRTSDSEMSSLVSQWPCGNETDLRHGFMARRNETSLGASAGGITGES